MRVALIQLAYADELPQDVRRAGVAQRVRSVGVQVDLVVLPELWSAGAFTARRWAERAEDLDGPTCTALAEAAAGAGCMVHVGSIIERDEDSLYNTAVLLGPDGARRATYRKIHRFGAAGPERDLLAAGEEPVVAEVPLRAGGNARVGLATCYDLRFPELFRCQVRDGAVITVVAASWPAARSDAWRLLLRARAVENQTFVLGCGAAGVSGRTAMAGASIVLGPSGEELAAAAGAPDEDDGGAPEAVVTCEFDLAEADRVRADFPVLADRRLDRC